MFSWGLGPSLTCGGASKLEDIRRDLNLLEEQGKVVGFLTKTENVQRVGGLVEDIREALMGYQVCLSNYSFYRL